MMNEAKRLARQGLPHPDPAVRAAVVRRQRRWYGLAWYPAVAGSVCIVPAPAMTALAWTTGDWWWMGAAALAVLAAIPLLLVAFTLWATGLRSGWLAAPNLPDVPPAPLPLRVRGTVLRSPAMMVFVLPPLLIAEWTVIAITVEPARRSAISMGAGLLIPLAIMLVTLRALPIFGPQVIIDAHGVVLPAMRVALTWDQVAEIRAFDWLAVGLAILPRQPVKLPWWSRFSTYRSPWLLVPDAMMATPVEIFVSTARHARAAAALSTDA